MTTIGRPSITDNSDGWGVSLNLWICQNVTKKHFQSRKNCAIRKVSQLSTPAWDGWGMCKHWRILRQSTCYHKKAGQQKNWSHVSDTCNVELGNICCSVCQYAKAKIYYEKALEIAMEIGHRGNINEIWSNTNLETLLQPVGKFASEGYLISRASTCDCKGNWRHEQRSHAVCWAWKVSFGNFGC